MREIVNDRMRKVKSILVTQEAPADVNSPYIKLAERFNLKIDFIPFIQVEPVQLKEFRKQKIEILNFTAVIFTSRNAVDHFFSDVCGDEDRGPCRHEILLYFRANFKLLTEVYSHPKKENIHGAEDGAGPHRDPSQAQERKVFIPLLRHKEERHP